ncbi:MAG: DJ-1/PfpI family protein [Sulfurospirillum sp.]|nr:DJ-1/PfpI family protein [Sulfurospirillum sp.]
MAKVLVPLATGFEEIEAITIIDVLRRADIEVVSVCLERRRVMGAHGIRVLSDRHIADVDYKEFDMIVLPGGLPGATNLRDNAQVKQLLENFDADHKYIAAICAAPIALDRAKVLKKAFTCYPSFENQIDHKGYFSEESVVSDQNIITSKGPATAMEFAIFLVEKLQSKTAADAIAQGLLLRP